MIYDKIEQVVNDMKTEHDGLPGVRLSVGIAFGDRVNSSGDILRDADYALERARTEKKRGCAIY